MNNTLNKMGIGARLYLGFSLIVAILVTLLTVAYINFSKLNDANDWNDHTYQVLGASQQMLESLINMETGQRGFALTGAQASLEPFNAGLIGFKKALTRVRSLTADNAQQQQRIKALEEAEQQWRTTAAAPAIALRQATGLGTARSSASSTA